jgi:hypothetical protein
MVSGAARTSREPDEFAGAYNNDGRAYIDLENFLQDASLM